MNRSDIITLISPTWSNDARGVAQTEHQDWIWDPFSFDEGVAGHQAAARQVFCRVRSISASESFQAAQAGLKAAWRFTVHPDEYRGESLVRYQGGLYSVYRTYQSGPGRLELYVEVKAGV